jgi:hypothetical protein
MPILSIDVEARLAQFTDALNKMQRDAGRAAGQIERAFAGAGKALRFLGVAYIGSQVIGSVRDTVDELAELNDGATAAGTSVESLSSLLNTLRPTGVGLEQIVDLAGKITRAMKQAEVATSDQARAFAALGVSFRNADGSFRGADDVLTDVARAMAGFESDANKVAVAQALLSKTGAQYLPLLGDLASRQREAASATSEQARAADDLKDRLGEIADAFRILREELLAPIASPMLNLITRFIGLSRAGIRDFDLVGQMFDDPKNRVVELEGRVRELTRIREQLAEKGDPSFLQRAFNPALRTREDIDRELVETAGEIGRLNALQERIDVLRGGVQAQSSGKLSFAAPAQEPRKVTAAAVRAFEDFEAKVSGIVSRLVSDAPVVKARELEVVIERLNGLLTIGLDPKVYAGALESALVDLTSNSGDSVRALELLDRAFFDLGLSAEDYDKILQRIFNRSPADGAIGERQLRELADGWRDAIEPMRVYIRQLDEIARLESAGFLSPDAAKRARQIVQDRANAEFVGVDDQTKQLSDAARDLGLSFTSAFEDAIVEGKNLRDVLSSIEQDIIRIIARKLVTEPLANAISGIAGTLLGGLFGGGKAAPISASIPTYIKATGGIVGPSGDMTLPRVTAFASGGIMTQHGAVMLPGHLRSSRGASFGGASLPIASAFAEGGIMTPFGTVPLRTYARGGVATSPQAAIFGEGSMPEAYVPLPDGRTIPVTMQGGSGGGDVIVNIAASDVESFRRSEAQVKARVAGWAGGAGRFR